MSRYYMLTIPEADFTRPETLIDGLIYMKGQLEQGEGGYRHWQMVVVSHKKCRASAIKRKFGSTCHVEITRSAAANEYVHKDDTCVDPETRFEVGRLPVNRNEQKDWDRIWESAKRGAIDEIPADVRVRSYKTIRQIEKDYMAPVAMERKVRVYWGTTGLGKSRRAWYEASMNAYPKSPTSIYWDGYQRHENVVIDEFRGGINISHVLRWFDRYPVCVECKFGACILNARNVWITSNINPSEWYPELDRETTQALLRRLEITEMTEPWVEPLVVASPVVSDVVDLTQEDV
uniref:Putative rep protein n=1 Tax=uncultured virus TaxID=340016 RepID=A0A1D8MK51_9VIRU|nr:putative rep protein [uncultured virus]